MPESRQTGGVPLWVLLTLTCFVLPGAGASGIAKASHVADSAKALEQKTANLSPELRHAFRLSAAVSLHDAYPEIARRFVELTVAEAREAQHLEPDAMSALAQVAPEEAIGLLPYLPAGSDGPLLNQLIYWHHTARALKLYRAMLSHGNLAILQANPLLGQLAKENPPEAVKLFGEILTRFRFEKSEPLDAWALLNCAGTMAQLAPGPSPTRRKIP